MKANFADNSVLATLEEAVLFRDEKKRESKFWGVAAAIMSGLALFWPEFLGITVVCAMACIRFYIDYTYWRNVSTMHRQRRNRRVA